MSVPTPRFYALCKTLSRFVSSGDYVLIGSAPLALLSLRDVNDLDVLATERGLYAIAQRSEWKREGRAPPGMLGRAWSLAVLNTPEGPIQMSSSLIDHAATCGLTEADIFRDARLSTAAGHRVISIEHMTRIKRARGMEKDTDDLQLLAGWREAIRRESDASYFALDTDIVPGRFSGPALFGIPSALREHTFDDHTGKGCTVVGCEVCEGGLRRCVVCLAQEGGLTSECPGEAVPLDQSDLVWKGKLDFIRGAWTTDTISPWSPAARQ